MTPNTQHLALPFFDDVHCSLAAGLVDWAASQQVDETDDRTACREWVQRLGDAGWLRYCVPAEFGGALPKLDSRLPSHSMEVPVRRGHQHPDGAG